MPSDLFERLADEIILEILEHLLGRPYFRSYKKTEWYITLCNKRLRRIALSFLYNTAIISNLTALQGFLQNMITYPEHARSVKGVKVLWYVNDHAKKWSKASYIVCTETARIYYPHQAVVQNIEKNDPQINVISLLHLLPHLESLAITSGHGRDKSLVPYLVQFLNHNHSSTAIHTFEWGDFDLDLRTLIPVLLVPSLKEFVCAQTSLASSLESCSLSDLPHGTNLASWYGKSNVEELYLSGVKVNGDDLVNIARLPRNLKILTYFVTHQYSRDTSQLTYVDLQRALDHAAHSLEFLKLYWKPSTRHRAGPKLCFRNFRSLKFLALECSILQDSLASTSTISKSLPPSLEVLYTMDCPLWMQSMMVELWRDILNEKSSTYLPSLWFVGNENPWNLLSPLIDLANSRNVQIAKNRDETDDMKKCYLYRMRSSWR
jgi:hypothetical protein